MLGRCGASTVLETAAVGLPAVFVPYPHGNGEQARNAAGVVEAGGGLLLADADCTPEWVASRDPGAARATRSGWPEWPRPWPALAGRDAATVLAPRAAGGGIRLMGAADHADRTAELSTELGPVHFIAIGGSGMNGIAVGDARSSGVEVSGSDRQDSKYLQRPGQARGARVLRRPRAEQLGDARTVVASSAIREDNPELAEARPARPAGAAPQRGAGLADAAAGAGSRSPAPTARPRRRR